MRSHPSGSLNIKDLKREKLIIWISPNLENVKIKLSWKLNSDSSFETKFQQDRVGLNIVFDGILPVGMVFFLDLIRIRLNIETNSPLNPSDVDYIFIWPNSLSVVCDLAAVNNVTQDIVSCYFSWVLDEALNPKKDGGGMICLRNIYPCKNITFDIEYFLIRWIFLKLRRVFFIPPKEIVKSNFINWMNPNTLNFILKYVTEIFEQVSILVFLNPLEYIKPVLLVDLEAGDNFLDQVPGSTQLKLVSQIIQIEQIIKRGYIWT